MESIIDDITLAQAGEKKQQWVRDQMTVLDSFRQRYVKEQPYTGKKIVVCMHCEPKGAVRTEALLAGGAEKIIFVGNLGSTKPETAAYLATLPRVTVLARQHDTLEDLNRYVELALAEKADLFMDNGASLMLCYDRKKPDWKPIGAIEETRSGQLLLEKEGVRPDFPLLVIDDSPVKRLIENEAGVGQSVVDGFMRATSMLLGGKKLLIIGYGFCGQGIAQRFRALGASTMVYDIDPLRRLKAHIEGHTVGRLESLLAQADAVITVTGRFDIIGPDQVARMKHKAILCNAGHYNMEICVGELEQTATQIETLSDGLRRFSFGEKDIYLLQEGNPLNLSAAAGNPLEIMEVGYALQLLSLEKILKSNGLAPGIHPLPDDINSKTCELCLSAWGEI